MWYRQCKAPIMLAYSIGLLTQLTPKKSGWEVWLGTLKMRDMNLRDMKMRHHVAGVEIARHENARSAIVWNTECCICLSIAELLKVFTRLCDDVWRWRIQICTRSWGICSAPQQIPKPKSLDWTAVCPYGDVRSACTNLVNDARVHVTTAAPIHACNF